MAGLFAGTHFLASAAFGIAELQVQEAEAREVSAKFLRMMEAWGVPIDGAMSGRIGATLTFATVFLIVEMQRIAVFNQVMTARQNAARAQTQAREAEPVTEGPAPQVHPVTTGVGAMTDRPFDLAAE